MDDFTKAQMYALGRLQGLGSSEAARDAGYNQGRPTVDALDLHDKARSVLKGELEREAMEDQLLHHTEMASQMRAMLRARDVVDMFAELL